MSDFVEANVYDLSSPALDWAVAKAEGLNPECWKLHEGKFAFSPSTDWSQGGPMIEKHGIRLERLRNGYSWYAGRLLDSAGWNPKYEDFDSEVNGTPTGSPLIAACRAVITSIFGDTVSVPKELIS